jgi:hypothetical protein
VVLAVVLLLALVVIAVARGATPAGATDHSRHPSCVDHRIDAEAVRESQTRSVAAEHEGTIDVSRDGGSTCEVRSRAGQSTEGEQGE